MAEAFLLRKGGGGKQAAAPSINVVSVTENSITYNITNNDEFESIIYYDFNDNVTSLTETNITLASGVTSSNFTETGLTYSTSYFVEAMATVFGKAPSSINSTQIQTAATPDPTINFISKTESTLVFTFTNNSTETRNITYGLTTPPTTTTISVGAGGTSSQQTISALTPLTEYTIYAQAQGSGIVSNTQITADPPVYTVATGGNVTGTYESGGKFYKYHQFNSNGTFSVSQVGNGTRDQLTYFIVAGGGGTSTISWAGGGGGGGLLSSTITNPGINSYSIVVGAGGASTTSNAAGSKGGDSSAFSIVTTGGGAGTAIYGGGSGGSGGGGGGWDVFGPGGAGTSGQGNNGGAGARGTDQYGSDFYCGGGGGGRSGGGGNAVGNTTDAYSSRGGNGGNGLTSSITGTSIAYAGGGGGGGYIAGFTPNGSNGAGSGSTANRGGGGIRGAGGSGVVIVRYEVGSL